MRARIEHCFRVIKCQFGYQQGRYKRLEKNRVQVFSLLALTNLYMLRGQLTGYNRPKFKTISNLKVLWYN